LTTGDAADRIGRDSRVVRHFSSEAFLAPPFSVEVHIVQGEARIMLVLSRKKNESIVIDGEVTITVVEVRGDKVRLGIEAPREVPIHRSEVYEAIHRAQQQEAKDAEGQDNHVSTTES
jgi:carbon storage regulator